MSSEIITGTLLFAFGLFWLYNFVLIPKEKKDKCTTEVLATCIGSKVWVGGNRSTYTPVWEYYYNNQWYQSYNIGFYSMPYELYKNKTIKINPKNPECFSDNETDNDKLLIFYAIVSTIFLFLGAGLLTGLL